MKINPVSLFLLVMLLLAGNLARAANITASIDRNPVNLSDSFQLVFNADETPDGSPDFAPLEAQFDIISQQQSSNVSAINGKFSRSIEWTLILMAKQSGELTIPAIDFGNDRSNPLSITVNEKQNAAQSGDEIFLEVEASPEKPYVQSQLIYTVRLFLRVQVMRPNLSEPEARDALIEKLGDDSSYQTQVNGVTYTVVERKYAIFPQQSGILTIAPLVLTTEVVSTQRRRFNSFFNPPSTETRRLSSKAITVEVQPAPKDATANGQWLVADSLELSQSWSNPDLQTQVGEPLTRTLRIVARGTTVGQLPELANPATIDGLKHYPDQPVLKEEKQHDGLLASREEKIAYIANKSGVFNLPAIEINWFNNKTQRFETASLPAVSLKVTGGVTPPTSATNPNSVTTAQPTLPTAEPASSGDDHFWRMSAIVLALGWFLNALWFNRDIFRKPKISDAETRNQKPADWLIQLKNACNSNDPQAAKQAVICWGMQRFAAGNLSNIAEKCSSPLREQIEQLNQCLYANTPASWSGSALWTAFRKHPENDKKRENDDALEPLFKL